MFFSACNALLSLSIMANSIAFFSLSTLKPWPGWSAVHETAGQIAIVPAERWTQPPTFADAIPIVWGQWNKLIYALTFFAFFGCGRDARRRYSEWARATLRCVGVEVHSRDKFTGGTDSPIVFATSP